MPTRRSLHLIGLQSPILPLRVSWRKKFAKWRDTFKSLNKSACKDSQFLIDRRSARSVPRHHRTVRAFLYERRSYSCPRSHSKERRRLARYVAGIHVFAACVKPKTWMAGTGHDGGLRSLEFHRPRRISIPARWSGHVETRDLHNFRRVDDEASVWSGHCDDIPAAADAPTLDEVLAKISAMALDLFPDNRPSMTRRICFCKSRRSAKPNRPHPKWRRSSTGRYATFCVPQAAPWFGRARAAMKSGTARSRNETSPCRSAFRAATPPTPSLGRPACPRRFNRNLRGSL